MSYTDKQIIDLINANDWSKIKAGLVDTIKGIEGSFCENAAFVIAVSHLKDRNSYPIAYNCFIKANLSETKDARLLQDMFVNIDTIIQGLGLKYFDNANSNKISPVFYLMARFMLFLKESRYNDAHIAISTIIKEHPAPVFYFQRSKLFGLRKQFKLALADLDEAIKLAPNYAEAYFCRAALKQRMKNLKGSLEDFDAAINCNNVNPKYYFARGLLHEDFNNYKNAIDDFKKVISIDSKDVDAYTELAWCKYKTNNGSEALSLINTAINMKGSDKDKGTFYVRGAIYNSMQKYQEAVEDLKQAYILDNQANKVWTSRVLYQKTWAEFKLEKYQDAKTSISNAIKLNPKNIPYYMLAMDIEYLGTKDYFAAKGLCMEILKIDPNNARAKEVLPLIQQNL